MDIEHACTSIGYYIFLAIRVILVVLDVVEQEFVHDAEKGLSHSVMRLALQLSLMVLAMHEQVLEQVVEELHCEHGVIQIRILAERLLEVPQERERVCRVDLFGKLEDTLQLDDEA